MVKIKKYLLLTLSTVLLISHWLIGIPWYLIGLPIALVVAYIDAHIIFWATNISKKIDEYDT